MRGVLAPLLVGAKVGDGRLDLDDQQRAVASERDDVGAAAVEQRQFGNARVAARPEQPANAARDL